MQLGRIAPARLWRAPRSGTAPLACLILVAALALGADLARAAASASDSEVPAADVGDLDDLSDPVDLVLPPRDFKVRWSADQRFTFGADFDGTDADEQRYRMGVRMTRRISPRLAIRLSASGQASLFDFDGPTDLIPGMSQPGDPFDSLYKTQVLAAALYRFADSWSLAGGGIGRSSLESGGDFGDSLVGGGFVALGYELGNRLELGAGLQVRSRLRSGGPTISPLLRLRWRITESLRLETRGRGLKLRFKPNRELELWVSGRFESDRYRMDETGTPLGAGILRVRQAPVAAGVLWRPLRWLEVGLEAGAMVYQKLRTQDDNGNNSSSISADPAPFMGTRFELRF